MIIRRLNGVLVQIDEMAIVSLTTDSRLSQKDDGSVPKAGGPLEYAVVAKVARLMPDGEWVTRLETLVTFLSEREATEALIAIGDEMLRPKRENEPRAVSFLQRKKDEDPLWWRLVLMRCGEVVREWPASKSEEDGRPIFQVYSTGLQREIDRCLAVLGAIENNK